MARSPAAAWAAAFAAGGAITAAAILAIGSPGGSDPDIPARTVAERLPALRGLRFKRVPEVRLVSKSELAKLSSQQVAALLRRLSPAQRARVERFKREARVAPEVGILLGLLPPHPSRHSLDKVGQVEGVYDDVANRIYLVRDALGSDRLEIETALAHELTHALDDQYVGSDPLYIHSPLPEAPDAERAVREGSAVVGQARYAIRYLGEPGPVSLYLASSFPAEPTGDPLARIAQKELQFAYVSGARFIDALYRRGGWPLVNRALRNPPRTTAAILFPQRWPGHEVSRPPVGGAAATLGRGWVRVLRGDVGAFSTEELFFLSGPRQAVDRLVRDWRGGRVEVWQRRGARVDPGAPDRRSSALVAQWRWRAPEDAAAAGAAIASYLVKTFQARSAGGGGWRFAHAAAASASAGAQTALVLAPTPALARAAATAAARP